MTLISFLYRKYYRVDSLCETTTSSTTRSTTTVITAKETTSKTGEETTASKEWTSYRHYTIGKSIQSLSDKVYFKIIISILNEK